MSQAYLPNIRRRLLADPDSPYAPMGDESIVDAPPTGMGAGPYSPPVSAPRPGGAPTLNAGAYAPPASSAASSPMNAYSARLGDVSKELQSAYSAPHAGTLRQVLGAFVGRRNPELGGIISGETQRQRAIEPLEHQYQLINGMIQANRAQQNQEVMNHLHEAQTEFYGPRTQALLNPPPKQTPDEQAFEDLVKGGMSKPDALERIRNLKEPQVSPETSRHNREMERIQQRGQDKTDDRQRELNEINRDTKFEKVKQAEETSLNGFNADMDRLAAAANELKEHPGLKNITGVMGALPNIPGGAAANAQAKFDTLKSQVAFGVLQNLRNASKTGGALGQVSDKEEQMLSSNLASLSKAQSADELKKSLQQIIDYTAGAKERGREAFSRTYGGGKSATTPTKTEGKYARPKPNVVVEQ